LCCHLLDPTRNNRGCVVNWSLFSSRRVRTLICKRAWMANTSSSEENTCSTTSSHSSPQPPPPAPPECTVHRVQLPREVRRRRGATARLDAFGHNFEHVRASGQGRIKVNSSQHPATSWCNPPLASLIRAIRSQCAFLVPPLPPARDRQKLARGRRVVRSQVGKAPIDALAGRDAEIWCRLVLANPPFVAPGRLPERGRLIWCIGLPVIVGRTLFRVPSPSRAVRALVPAPRGSVLLTFS